MRFIHALLDAQNRRGPPTMRFCFHANRKLTAYPLPSISHRHHFVKNSSSSTFPSPLTSSSIAFGSAESSSERKCRLPPDFLSTLQRFHPSLLISINPYDLDSHGHGESYHPIAPPDAVIRPTSVQEIQDILRLCCQLHQQKETNVGEDIIPTMDIVSVIPYGAGTSLEGHLQFLLPAESIESSVSEVGEIVQIPSSCLSNETNNSTQSVVRVRRKGGISLDMSNFQSIGEVGDDCFVKVGAGVTRNALNEVLRHKGMQFMVDPGADATIGGMCACAASGTAAVKYGTMKENVMAMTVVFPPTTTSIATMNKSMENEMPKVCHLGCNALKSSAGYNLPALLTGSEGTLGVITEVTVKLHPIPSHVIAASCVFADLHSAANAVATIRLMGIPVSRIELLDEMSIQAFNHSLAIENGVRGDGGKLHLQPMEVTPTLFVEFSSHSEIGALEDLAAAQNICTNEFGGSQFVSASDETTRKSLWAARHRLYYSAIALRAGGSNNDDDEGPTSQSTIVTDVCVPLSHFADIISATAKDIRELGVVGPCFGHAGDGNFHCILPLKKNDTEQYKGNVHQVVENMIARAMAVGGSCTGEHGVGYGKKKYLEKMYGSGGVALMKAVKRAIDPWNIMNPGKIVDTDFYR